MQRETSIGCLPIDATQVHVLGRELDPQSFPNTGTTEPYLPEPTWHLRAQAWLTCCPAHAAAGPSSLVGGRGEGGGLC